MFRRKSKVVFWPVCKNFWRNSTKFERRRESKFDQPTTEVLWAVWDLCRSSESLRRRRLRATKPKDCLNTEIRRRKNGNARKIFFSFFVRTKFFVRPNRAEKNTANFGILFLQFRISPIYRAASRTSISLSLRLDFLEWTFRRNKNKNSFRAKEKNFLFFTLFCANSRSFRSNAFVSSFFEPSFGAMIIKRWASDIASLNFPSRSNAVARRYKDFWSAPVNSNAEIFNEFPVRIFNSSKLILGFICFYVWIHFSLLLLNWSQSRMNDRLVAFWLQLPEYFRETEGNHSWVKSFCESSKRSSISKTFCRWSENCENEDQFSV